MGRRRRGSNRGSPIKLLALMPWWLCFVLAIASYFALHAWATMPPPKLGQGSLGISKGNSLVLVMVVEAIRNVALPGNGQVQREVPLKIRTPR